MAHGPTGKALRFDSIMRAYVCTAWLPSGIQTNILRPTFALFPFAPPSFPFFFVCKVYQKRCIKCIRCVRCIKCIKCCSPDPPNLVSSNFSWLYGYFYNMPQNVMVWWYLAIGKQILINLAGNSHIIAAHHISLCLQLRCAFKAWRRIMLGKGQLKDRKQVRLTD